MPFRISTTILINAKGLKHQCSYPLHIYIKRKVDVKVLNSVAIASDRGCTINVLYVLHMYVLYVKVETHPVINTDNPLATC